MLFVVQHIAILAVAYCVVAGAGAMASPRSSLAMRCAIGVAVWAHALFFLALIGSLGNISLVALALVSFAGLFRARCFPLKPPLMFVLLLAAMIVIALRPPLAFDETLYHLPFVKALADSGRLAFQPDIRFPVFPQMQELLCVPLYLLAGDTATHLAALIETGIAIAILYEWGSRLSHGTGLLAASLFAGSPIVVHLGTATLVDAPLALLVAAGFRALDERRYALSAFLLGTACGFKYLGGYFALAALIIVIVTQRKAIPQFAAILAAAALPMTLWLTILTRDPVFPFGRASAWSHSFADVSIADRSLRFLRVAWDVTFARGRVNTQPPFTPLLIPMLAIVIAASWRDTRARLLLLMAAGYVAIFTFLHQDSRYLVPLLPLFAGVAAVGVTLRLQPRTMTMLSVIAIAPALAYCAYVLTVRGLPPLTAQARETFLSARVPEYRALTQAKAETVYACGAEQLKWYARGRYLGDLVGPYSIGRVIGDASSTSAIAERLRGIDVRRYLVAKRVCPPPRSDGGMDLVYEDAAAQLWSVR